MKLIQKLFQFLLLPLIIAGAFFVWSLPRITSDYNFNSDELIYLSRSQYWEAFKSGDAQNPIWQTWGAYDQPQLTNYVYAAVPGDRSLLDHKNSPCKSVSESTFFSSWSCLDGPPLSTWSETLTPLKDLVVHARVLATLISALAIASTYYVGLMVGGPLTGILAAAYLGYYSFFRNLSTMVMMDQILLLLLNLQLMITLSLSEKNKVNVLQTTLLGLATGLALSTKFSALIPTALMYGYLAVKNLRLPKNLVMGAMSLILAGSVFIALHPPLWSNPLGWTQKMIAWRLSQIETQTDPTYQPANLADKVRYTLRETLSSWQSESDTKLLIPFLVISMLGIIMVAKKNPLFTFFTLTNLAVFILLLPIKWNRYLLPVMPSIAVAVAVLPALLLGYAKLISLNWSRFKQLILTAVGIVMIVGCLSLIPMLPWLSLAILATTLFLTLQGYLVTRAMLHGIGKQAKDKSTPHKATASFSLVVPARNEKDVIGATIKSLTSLNYPKDLYEVLVMIRSDDHETQDVAELAVKHSSGNNIRLIKIDGDAHSKAYSLNLGIHLAQHDYIGVFDAEDEPHRDILQKVNDYLFTHPGVHAVQAPVHLINLNSAWYASLNAVEYYFWFRSVLPYLAKHRVVPLGGNTIFTHKETLKSVGGYDENCLTEDADLGIRLAAQGAKIGIMTDPSIATREETPSDEMSLIRQRARWDQGYLQVLSKSVWTTLAPTQKFFTLYTLTQPIFRHLSFLNMIFSPLLASLGTIPVWLALLSFLPGYFLCIQLGLYGIGLSDLARIHQIKVGWTRYALMIISFIPYQALLALATTRAIGKIVTGNYKWDKTEHVGSHRTALAILEG